MRASLADIDIALSNLHRAVARFEAACGGVRLPAVPAKPPAAYLDLQAREAVAREWVGDPCGFRHGVSFAEYAEQRGFAA